MEFVRDVFPYVIAVVLAATLSIMAVSVVAMLRGGTFKARYGPEIRRVRVVLQVLTVVLLLAMFLISGP